MALRVGFISRDFNFFGIPEEWETASPLPGRGAGLTGAMRVGGKGAAALGCSYPSSGIFPEGNRNCVFKQPVPSIVGSICSLFSITAPLFLDASLHPAAFAHAVRNPIHRSRHPCSRPSVPQKHVGALRIFRECDLNVHIRTPG